MHTLCLTWLTWSCHVTLPASDLPSCHSAPDLCSRDLVVLCSWSELVLLPGWGTRCSLHWSIHPRSLCGPLLTPCRCFLGGPFPGSSVPGVLDRTCHHCPHDPSALPVSSWNVSVMSTGTLSRGYHSVPCTPHIARQGGHLRGVYGMNERVSE